MAEIEVLVFGREECPGSKESREIVEESSLPENSKSVYYDVDTVCGRAEAAFYDVIKGLPTTIILEEGKVIKRWDGVPLPKEEFKQEIDRYAQS